MEKEVRGVGYGAHALWEQQVPRQEAVMLQI